MDEFFLLPQLVTTGTDRKITYWDAFDGQAIRIVDGSDSAEINSIAISTDGTALVSGGGDKDVKVRAERRSETPLGCPLADVYVIVITCAFSTPQLVAEECSDHAPVITYARHAGVYTHTHTREAE